MAGPSLIAGRRDHDSWRAPTARRIVRRPDRRTPEAAAAGFRDALQRRSLEPRRPLSPSWAPLARALVGRAEAKFVAGPRSRALLAEAGVGAATVGSTIYLPAPPDIGDPRQRDIVAHELTHVAARSRRPRFHGGPLDREERRARQVGGAAAGATATALRSLNVASLAVVGGGGVHQHNAAEKAEPLPVLQRVALPSAGSTPMSALGPTGSIAPSSAARSGAARSMTDPLLSPPQTSNTTIRRDEIDALLEALEDRVLADLERRGGRFAGEF